MTSNSYRCRHLKSNSIVNVEEVIFELWIMRLEKLLHHVEEFH